MKLSRSHIRTLTVLDLPCEILFMILGHFRDSEDSGENADEGRLQRQTMLSARLACRVSGAVGSPGMGDPGLANGLAIADPDRLIIFDLTQGPQPAAVMLFVGLKGGLLVLKNLDLQRIGEDAGDEDGKEEE
ncbi:uncharacterized protein BP01DRAFT_384980 [Aspergillus saccharolyticus JOP 1030-1]|uniref:Uncharacterized protein n=1 Tax=Aspergillus saccharolyticus JOP 1030-1 TaxID=1450539 RepID=A0A318Z6V4_9EURO|nr:hypothetical protein BP01DRAFT_384980 [Aspergillus saccharolyticus JOP 1030-1]PYH43035.1 hypothetical protein BP01DRAFT_384980 [Aspergillus saccharolyticus JOP 1030-1]